MSVRRLENKKWEWTCDNCQQVEHRTFSGLPSGWVEDEQAPIFRRGGHGQTHLCEECSFLRVGAAAPAALPL